MMKKTLLVFLFAAGILMSSFAEAIAEEAAGRDGKADISYAFGMAVAADLKRVDLSLNYGAFMRGFRELMENQETRIPLGEAMDMVDAAIIEAIAVQAEANLQKETAFLAQNAAREGVHTTASGLQYEILVEGSGEQPSSGDRVKAHYTGALMDGTIFDSSFDRGEPEEFFLQGVIPGWSEGIQLMRAGGKARLFIPSKLGYGSQGAGGIIPPNSPLVFEVELLEILGPPPEMTQPESGPGAE